MPLPPPVPNGLTQPFWDYCARGELRAQRCAGCDKLRYPPRPACPHCGSFDFEWARLSGKGSLYSYIISHQAIHPALAGLVPFTTIMVELDEGLIMTSSLVDCPLDQVKIGMPLRVVFEPLSEKISLPRFRPAQL